jgi:1-deoxy-D-xylulose 5-phosphate reductoisomerase
MFVPIYNFLSTNIKKNIIIDNKKYIFRKKQVLNFMDIDIKKFPIYKIFKNLDKSLYTDIIKFNCANEIAVEYFKENKIKYSQIHEFIDNSLGLDFNHPINTIDQIIDFQNNFKMKLCQ